MKIKILSVTPLYPSDIDPVSGVFVKNRVEAMASYAHVSVTRLEPWYKRNVFHRLASTAVPLEVRRFFSIPKFLKRLDASWASRCVIRKLELLNAELPDAIDSHFGFPIGTACYIAGQKTGIPTFITIRGNEIQHFRKIHIRSQLVQALNGCAGVIAVSENLKQAAVDAGVREEQIVVIGNGVDSKIFHPGGKAAVRAKLHVSNEVKLIVCVCKLNHVKRLDVLLNAFAKLCTRMKHTQLVIVGGADYDRNCPHQILTQIQSLELQNLVRVTGNLPQSQVAMWLQAADLFAFSSEREGSCNAIREASACGLPIVSTRVGDVELVVKNNNFGLLVDIGDAQSMATQLEVALNSQWRHDQIAREAATENWQAVGQKIVTFIQARI